MTLSTIYIVRHGYRSNWLPLDQQVAPLTGIESDPPLAPHGVDQSKELAKYVSQDLQKEGFPTPQMVFSSPFYRCVETIYPTAEALDLQIHVDRGVGEWFKTERATIPIPATGEKLHKFFDRVPSPTEWPWDTIIPSVAGETEEAIYNRCKTFWSKFIPKMEKRYPNVETIIIVTHAAPKVALGMTLMGYKNSRDFLGPQDGGDGKTVRLGGSTCSVDAYRLQDDESWRLLFNSQTKFLSCGAEMDWHFATSQFEAGSTEDIEYRRKIQLEQDKVNNRTARQCRL